MAIDWANDPFARLYKRETDDDLLLSWEARAVWHEFIKKCDQSGLLETRRGVRGLAALIRVPVEVVERVLQELIEDGRMRSVPNKGFIAPNYLVANFTPRSDNARQADSRLRRRMEAMATDNQPVTIVNPSLDVTRGHTASLAVTHNSTDHTHHIGTSAPAAPVETPFELQETPAKRRGRPPKARHGIPHDWRPRDQERELAASLGLDCDVEAREFLNWWLADGRPKKDWHQTFANRLEAQAKRGGGGWRPPEQVRQIKEL